MSAQLARLVRPHREAHGISPSGRDLRRQRIAVAVADLKRPRGLGYLHQFITGGKNGHTRPAIHFDSGLPGGGRHSDLRRTQAHPAAKNLLTSTGFGPGVDNVLSGDRSSLNFYFGFNPAGSRIFDHYDRIRAFRNSRAGHNLDCLALGNHAIETAAGLYLPHHAQRHRGRTHGVTIARGPREGGEGTVRLDRLG